MAKIHDNHMVAHLWANQSQAFARSHNGNLYFIGRAIWSYGEHFLAGVIFGKGAERVALINGESPSVTTGRHMSYIRQAARHLVCIHIPDMSDIGRELDRLAHRASLERARDLVAADVARVRAHLEREACADMAESDIARILQAIGSRAKAGAVLSRAKRAKQARLDRLAKEKRERLLGLARDALARPLVAFESFNPGDCSPMPRVSWGEAPLQLNRAWKAAKAAGWSAKRLQALRARENATRARWNRIESRAAFYNRRRHLLQAVKGLRGIIGEQSPGAAYARASLDTRMRILGAAQNVLGQNPRAFGFSVRDHWAIAESVNREASQSRALLAIRTRAARSLRHASAIQEWRDGTRARLPHGALSHDSPVMLRAVDVERDASGAITGGRLESSQGARVPLVQAVRVFRFLKLQRERFARSNPDAAPRNSIAWRANGERIRVGSFMVDHVCGDGSFKAGCHFIPWDETARLALALGVFDTAPSREAVDARAHA